MKTSEGFVFIILAVIGWMAACLLLDYYFPKKQPIHISFEELCATELRI